MLAASVLVPDMVLDLIGYASYMRALDNDMKPETPLPLLTLSDSQLLFATDMLLALSLLGEVHRPSAVNSIHFTQRSELGQVS